MAVRPSPGSGPRPFTSCRVGCPDPSVVVPPSRASGQTAGKALPTGSGFPNDAAQRAAALVHDAFDDYNARFADITRRARRCFERRDWRLAQRDANVRIDLYEDCVSRHGRALFYDFDELCLLEHCRFRAVPPVREEDEMRPLDEWL